MEIEVKRKEDETFYVVVVDGQDIGLELPSFEEALRFAIKYDGHVNKITRSK